VGGSAGAPFGVRTGSSGRVGLDGKTEWVLDEVREWVGGVGGSSNAVSTLLDWRFTVLGLEV
jgi:hypothetical protein